MHESAARETQEDEATLAAAMAEPPLGQPLMMNMVCGQIEMMQQQVGSSPNSCHLAGQAGLKELRQAMGLVVQYQRP